MTEITLVKADGNLLPLNSKEPLRQVKSAVMKEERMGEDTLTLVVEATLPIDFTVGDTLQALGKTYYLNTLPGVQRSARRHLTYTVVLESAKYDLAKTILVNEFAGGKETVNETEFSYTGEFDQLMDLAVINLNRTQGADSWQWRKVDTGADPDFDPQYQECKTLTFSCENVLSALNTICTDWGVEYRIETVDGRRTISVGQIGRQVYECRFAYGKARGLYSLTRSNASESSAPTRLYAYGSSQNLGTAYRERRRRLALPLEHPSPLIREGLYVQDDALVERFGLIEGAVIFDQVYPAREGTVSSVDPQDELKFTDLEMFDLNETDERATPNTCWGRLRRWCTSTRAIWEDTNFPLPGTIPPPRPLPWSRLPTKTNTAILRPTTRLFASPPATATCCWALPCPRRTWLRPKSVWRKRPSRNTPASHKDGMPIRWRSTRFS